MERLAVLCGYYQVPVAEILTGNPAGPPAEPVAKARTAAGVDLERLAAEGGPEASLMRRFAAAVSARGRREPGGMGSAEGLRIRAGDYDVLALILGTSAGGLRCRTAPRGLNPGS